MKPWPLRSDSGRYSKIVAWLKTLTGELPKLDMEPGTSVAANR